MPVISVILEYFSLFSEFFHIFWEFKKINLSKGIPIFEMTGWGELFHQTNLGKLFLFVCLFYAPT